MQRADNAEFITDRKGINSRVRNPSNLSRCRSWLIVISFLSIGELDLNLEVSSFDLEIIVCVVRNRLLETSVTSLFNRLNRL